MGVAHPRSPWRRAIGSSEDAQRRHAAQQPVQRQRGRRPERQRRLLGRQPAGQPGELLADREGERHGAAVAAGPAPGVRAEHVEARRVVGGHADVAAPDVVEAGLAELRPDTTQPGADAGAQPRPAAIGAISAPPVTIRERASQRAKCRSPWVSDMAGRPGMMVARDMLADRRGGELPRMHRHHLARDRRREIRGQFPGVGAGGEDERAGDHPAAVGGDDPGAVGAGVGPHRGLGEDAALLVEHRLGEAARERQRVDVAAAAVPEIPRTRTGCPGWTPPAPGRACPPWRPSGPIGAPVPRTGAGGRAYARAGPSRSARPRRRCRSAGRARTAGRPSRRAWRRSALRRRHTAPPGRPGRALRGSGSPARCCGPSRPSLARGPPGPRRRSRSRRGAARWRGR